MSPRSSGFVELGGDGAHVRLALREQLVHADTTGPVRAPLLALDDAATAELAALLEHVSSRAATVAQG